MPRGAELVKEANRLGVSWDKSDVARVGLAPTNEPELQSRVLAARNERRNAFSNAWQTVGILVAIATGVGSILLTQRLHREDHKAQVEEQKAEANLRSAELMLDFADDFSSGPSKVVERALEANDNLDSLKDSDEKLNDELADFLGNYDMLDEAYRYNLINRDVLKDEFGDDLKNALFDQKMNKFLVLQRKRNPSAFDDVLDLATCLGYITSRFHYAYPCKKPENKVNEDSPP